MTYGQAAVTVRAFVRPGGTADLTRALDLAADQVEAGTSSLTRVPGVHFARLLIVPGDRHGAQHGDEHGDDVGGDPVPDSLIYLADVDGAESDHLSQLAAQAGDLLDGVFGCCTDYPRRPDESSRSAYLARHRIGSSATYINTVGLGVQQILEEERLRSWLEAYVDAHRADLAQLSPVTLHQALVDAVAADPEVADLRKPAPRPSLRFRVVELAHAVGVGALVIVASPALVVLGVPWLLLLRRLELRDVPDHERPVPADVERLRLQEDRFAANPFAAVGEVKPGLLRRGTMGVVLRTIAFGTRHVFNHGSLAGVTTIHFARWIVIDEKRRVIFASCYDGSLESYMDDFIDKLSWGLNVVFSNGRGYPRTRWLLFDGARDEQAFKDYLRRHQLGNAVTWSAYPTLTTANILANARLRAGITRDLDETGARAWLAGL